jgi:hypothetical protein
MPLWECRIYYFVRPVECEEILKVFDSRRFARSPSGGRRHGICARALSPRGPRTPLNSPKPTGLVPLLLPTPHPPLNEQRRALLGVMPPCQ